MTTSEDRPRRFHPWFGGLTLIGLGATLVVTGLLQTTSSHVTSPCPDNTELIAKFNFTGGRYVFEKPAEYAGVVTITNGTATGGDAHSSIPIVATIVKGGPDSVLVTYSPAQTNLHFSNAGLPLVGNGNLPDISNVQFCGNTKPPTTTTTTTTTIKPTTTTTTTTLPTSPTSPTSTSTTTTSSIAQSAPTTALDTTTSSTSTTQPPAATTSSVAQEAPVVTSTSLLLGGSNEVTALPHTGAPSVPLIALGIVLMAIGLTLTVVARARVRRANS